MSNEKLYRITLNAKQLEAISTVAEIASRVSIGQVGEVARLARMCRLSEETEESLKKELFPELSKDAYHSIGSEVSYQSGSQLLWDFYQVARNRLAFDNLSPGEKRGIGVNFDRPYKTDPDNDLVIIKQIKP